MIETIDDECDIVVNEREPEPPETANKWYQDVTMDEARAYIRENIASAASSFIAVGYYLKCVRDKGFFSQEGYETVWEFADTEYGISKSTASRYMTMNDRFSLNGNSPCVAPEYKGFGRSQLQEMLYLTDEQIMWVTPETQIKQIREFRRAEREIPYMDIPGQLSIEDFPDVIPEGMERLQELNVAPQAETQQAGSATLTLKDFAEDSGPSVATSQPEAVTQTQRGCVTGWSRYGFCACCGYEGARCCKECEEWCNNRCGWIEEPWTETSEESIPCETGETVGQDIITLVAPDHVEKCRENRQEWIPMSEREPLTHGDYLVTMKTDDCYGGEPYTDWMCWDCEGTKWTDTVGGPPQDDVIAWMPLPEPYCP